MLPFISPFFKEAYILITYYFFPEIKKKNNNNNAYIFKVLY